MISIRTIRGQRQTELVLAVAGTYCFSRRIEKRVSSREILDEVVAFRKVDVELVAEIHESFRCGTISDSSQVLNDSFLRTSRFDNVLRCLRKLELL